MFSAKKLIKVGGVKNSENYVTSFMHDLFNDLKHTPFTTTKYKQEEIRKQSTKLRFKLFTENVLNSINTTEIIIFTFMTK